MDTLESIFNMQREYIKMLRQAAAAANNNRMTNENLEERISHLCTAIIHEACELQDLTNWKWWKNPIGFDVEKAREELIDIWHFVVQISIELGMDAKDILDAYEKKNIINRERQLKSY